MGGFLGIKARSDHRFAADNLSPYLDGRLTAREKERLERHLAVCPDCRQELSTLRETVALLRQTPMRPVPRSFTLPVSVQAEQVQHRRWNMAYSFMRTATVVVSLLLVLVVSGDVLLGQGVIGIPDAYKLAGAQESRLEALEERTASAQLQAAPDTQAAPDVLAAPEAQAVPELQATPEVQPVPEVQPTPEVQAELELQALQAPDQAPEVEGEKALSSGEPAATEEAQAEAMLTAPGAEGEQEGIVQGAPIARSMGTTPANEVTPEEEVATSEADATAAALAAEPAEELPVELAEESVALDQAAPEEPQPEPDALTKQEAASPAYAGEGEQAPEAYGETADSAAPEVTNLADVEAVPERGAEGSIVNYGLSPMWTVWQMLRVIALVLGGVLLVLIGGLLWSGHKRQL